MVIFAGKNAGGRVVSKMTVPRLEQCGRALDRHVYVDMLRGAFENIHCADLHFLRANSQTVTLRRIDQHRSVDFRAFCRAKSLNCSMQIVRPNTAALERLAQLRHHLTKVELALDLIMRSSAEKTRLHHFITHHFFSRGMHHDQSVFFFDRAKQLQTRTFYSAPRLNSVVFVAYDDKRSRINKARNCLHLEYRLRHSAAQKAGINSISDLLDFDHHNFWKRHLTLGWIDIEKLGLTIDNLERGASRRRKRPDKSGKYCYNRDGARGVMEIWLHCNKNRNPRTQQFRCAFSESKPLKAAALRSVIPIDVASVLPAPASLLATDMIIGKGSRSSLPEPLFLPTRVGIKREASRIAKERVVSRRLTRERVNLRRR